MQLTTSNDNHYDKIQALDTAIKALQENDKLKAKAEKWRLKAEEIVQLWNEESEE